ncbi:hypothetical protein [Azospirillum picis]|uniref:SbsA Ig-like domain-containing protein n=1 Tax=Azospirillum picis TaxID=488438 RepID=A0ABU0MDI7_9PROT|nr:hypothetical protein [Azospirillum picis]MBP2297488.1 hypothetical protein [Azospirillum picis]MDQ0531489.1 hypothetical protein [Azospirillum picis]
MGMLSTTACAMMAAAVSVAMTTPASAQSAPDLQGYAAARFVPYADSGTEPKPFTGPARLSFLVRMPGGGSPGRFTMTMDTGSTGVVISAADLPGYSREVAAQYKQGWEFLSSSSRLWIGRWSPHEMVFLDPAGNQLATANVPVLAVETEYHCPGWNETLDEPTCTDPRPTPEMPTGVAQMPKGIAYLGVGFGREHDGQSQGNPDKNPLLNLVAVDSRPVQASSVRSGYVITRDGVHVGLTQANSQGFAWTKLQGRSLDASGKAASNDPRDWAQAGMAVSVNGQAAQSGPLLIDTGIEQMYLTVSDPSQLPTKPVPNPSLPGQTATGLVPGARVTVSFPDAVAPVAQYGFTVGDNADQTAPSVVLVTSGATPAFVNTGRHLLRGYDVAFDADGGWLGLRKSTP